MPKVEMSHECPTCGKRMAAGFLLAGEEGEAGFFWSTLDPRTEIVRPAPIQEKPKVRSFRLSGWEPNCVEGRRCEACRTVVFQWRETASR